MQSGGLSIRIDSMQNSCKRDVPPSSAPARSDKPPYYHPQNLSQPTSTHSFTSSTKLLNLTHLLLPCPLHLDSSASHTLIPISLPQSSLPLYSRFLLWLLNLFDTRRQTGRTLPFLTMTLLTEYCERASLFCAEGVAA